MSQEGIVSKFKESKYYCTNPIGFIVVVDCTIALTDAGRVEIVVVWIAFLADHTTRPGAYRTLLRTVCTIQVSLSGTISLWRLGSYTEFVIVTVIIHRTSRDTSHIFNP
jgi:hypothetical protein